MEKQVFLIGSYAPKGTPSVWEAQLDCIHGTLSAEPLSCEAENPSWILLHPDGRTLYAVEELVPAGRLAVMKKEGGRWYTVLRLPAGSAPCHLETDGRGEYLLCSNYMDGTLQVFRIGSDGIPEAETDVIRHSGSGPNRERQESAHIHSAWFHGGKVYSADLGLDRVSVMKLDRENGKLTVISEWQLPPGSGPRHIAFHRNHPNRGYVLGELNGRVYVLDLQTGEIVQELSAVPENWSEPFRASSVRFTGNTLYTGTRECNVISIFSLREDGTLSRPVICPHRQQTPRDVWMNDDWCITADEGSCCLTLLRREGSQLTEQMTVPTGEAHPTCILPWFPPQG